jgi:hypothetical protein
MSTPLDKPRPIERRGYRVRDWCAAFDTSPAMAYKMMADGRLPYVVIAGRRFITNETAEKLLSDGE